MKVWENSQKQRKHSPAARVPTAFFVLPETDARKRALCTKLSDGTKSPLLDGKLRTGTSKTKGSHPWLVEIALFWRLLHSFAIQNGGFCTMCRYHAKSPFQYITPYFKDLYWLPVAMQVEVRDVIMTYKSLNDLTL